MIAITVAVVAVGVIGTSALGWQAVRWQSPRRERGKRWRCMCYWRSQPPRAIVLAVALAALVTASAGDVRAPLHTHHHCRAETVGDTYRRECEYRRGNVITITEYSRTTYRVR